MFIFKYLLISMLFFSGPSFAVDAPWEQMSADEKISTLDISFPDDLGVATPGDPSQEYDGPYYPDITPEHPSQCKVRSKPFPAVASPQTAEVGSLHCSQKNCVYIAKKASPKYLAGSILVNVTGQGGYTMNQLMGHISSEHGNKELHFWHECREILDEIIAALPVYDVGASDTARQRYLMQLHVYQVRKGTLKQFSIGLNGLLGGVVNPNRTDTGEVDKTFDLPRAQVDNSSGVHLWTLNLGNLTDDLLSVQLEHANERNYAEYVLDAKAHAQDGEDFRLDDRKNVYTAPGFGSGQQMAWIGYRATGVIRSVEGHDNKVEISDLLVEYNTPTGDDPNFSLSNMLDVPLNNFQMILGRPTIIYEKKVKTNSRMKNRSINYKRENSETDEHLIIYLTVISQDLKQSTPKYTKLTPEIVNCKVPEGTKCLDQKKDNLKEILESARFEVLPLSNEKALVKDVIRFQLDENLLTKYNHDKMIEITVSGEGYAKSDVVTLKREVQALALNPFQFPTTVSGGKLKKSKDSVTGKVVLKLVAPKFKKEKRKINTTYQFEHYQSSDRVDYSDPKTRGK